MTKKQLFAKLDLNVTLICACSIGMGGGMLAGGLSQAVNISPTLAVCIFIAYAAAVLTIGLYANLKLTCAKQHKVDNLRASGILPDETTQCDADVIRLANEGKREEAALLYQCINGGRIEAARAMVGINVQKHLMAGTSLLLAALFLFLLYHFFKNNATHEEMLQVLLFGLVLVSNISIAALRSALIRKNREILEAGKLPNTPSQCAQKSLWKTVFGF